MPKKLIGPRLDLVDLGRPGSLSGYSLHGLAIRKDAKYWERLFGWELFDLSGVVAPLPLPLPKAAAKTTRRVSSPKPSVEEQWDAFLTKCVGTGGEQAPEWTKLAPALRALQDPPPSQTHGKRFLDPTVDGGSGCWKREDGGWPRKNTDWKYAPGKRGGGNPGSGGPIFVRKAFLKSVYVKQYARK